MNAHTRSIFSGVISFFCFVLVYAQYAQLLSLLCAG